MAQQSGGIGAQETLTTIREPGLPPRQIAATVVAFAWSGILLAAGLIALLIGIASFADSDLLLSSSDYVYRFGHNTWGWVHCVLGAVLIVSGLALITGRTWARAAAAFFAMCAVVANFLWLPHQPGWATVAIAINTVAIWAVSTWRPDDV